MIEEVNFHFEKPEENAGYLLWQTTMLWQKTMNRALRSIDITHTQFVAIAALGWLLKYDDNVTQKDIAEHSNTDRMMISKILRTLEKKNIVERKEHPFDTRAKCVFLTKSGKNILQEALSIVEKSDNSFFDTVENPKQFKEELTRIIEKKTPPNNG